MAELPAPMTKTYTYLSIIPSRRPVQKTHTNIGHVKNAVNAKFTYSRGAEVDMQVFEFIDSEWTLIYDIKQGDKEPPWREGEIEEHKRKKAAAAEREVEQEESRARGLARNALQMVDTYVDETTFIEAFTLGYMEKWREFRR